MKQRSRGGTQQQTAENTPLIGMLWLRKPLDWHPIDRFILLASLVMLATVVFSIALAGTIALAPQYLALPVAWTLLGLYGLHIILLASYIWLAWKRRRRENDWPAFENIVIAGFVINIMLSSYLTGTYFTHGLLFFFVGVNIASALTWVTKILVAYWTVLVTLITFATIDFSGAFKHAPLLSRSVYQPDGSPVIGWLFIEVTVAAIHFSVLYLCMLVIRRWAERENLYREMSNVDGLTRLINRRCFIERAKNELARAKRLSSNTPKSLGCIMLDLDHFKHINDTWGHHAGDAVLVAASEIMMANARPYDEVGRYGGEEFAILLPGVTLKIAAGIAERLRKAISDAVVEIDGNRISISASFGVACYPTHAISDLNDLLKAADQALYEAKRGGRNRVILANTTDQDGVTG